MKQLFLVWAFVLVHSLSWAQPATPTAPATPPVAPTPNESPQKETQWPPIVLSLPICQYCIAADEIRIVKADGQGEEPITAGSLTVTSIKYGEYYANGSVHTIPLMGAYWLSPDNRASDKVQVSCAILSSKLEHGRTIFLHQNNTACDVVLARVKPRKDLGASWQPRVKTAHVCLGSTFELRSFYFVDEQNRRMSGVYQETAHSPIKSELPQRLSQTICEGKLIPLEQVMQQQVARQAESVVDKLNALVTEQSIKDTLNSAAEKWLKENREDIAARAAAMKPQPAAR